MAEIPAVKKMKRFEDTYPDHPKGGFLYLASLFRKHPDGLLSAYLEASRAQGDLWKLGVAVFSPIACFYPTAVLQGIDQTDHETWMERDRPFMRAARGIIVLQQPGWEASEGIAEEREFFANRNSPEYSLEFPVCLTKH